MPIASEKVLSANCFWKSIVAVTKLSFTERPWDIYKSHQDFC